MHQKSVNEAWESPSQQYQGQNFRSIQMINLTAKACKNIEIITYIHVFFLIYKDTKNILRPKVLSIESNT